jgi:crotonobetainyl-CoA:carnitine CoA-transferase CaiB-like acyl-CoA transferase
MGALDGLEVLDLAWGPAGSIAGLLLSDQGARVTKLEPVGGDPFRGASGFRVWNRGKRGAVVDLPADADVVLALAERADVLIEGFSPGTTARLGIDYETVRVRNPRLIYCSITGYGRDNRHSDRPAYDALVGARTGIHWDQRGWPGGVVARVTGTAPNLPDLVPPDGCWEGVEREGPHMPYSTFPSLGAAFLATTAISAALHVREVTGRGQWVETSLLQGVLAASGFCWQRAEHPETPLYDTWVFDSRAIKGLFVCGDGRWVYHWVPNPAFVLGVSEGDELVVNDDVLAPRDDPSRILPSCEELVVLHYYHPLLAERFRKFPAADWVAAAAQVGVTMQPVLSPEEALADPSLLADGCVAVVDDPEVGPIRQVGLTIRMSETPGAVGGPAPTLGQHNEEVRREVSERPRGGTTSSERTMEVSAPLDGVLVLDLGLAVAGPYGTQLLSDLGADVIKINTTYDMFWHTNHIAMMCNRGKRSLSVDLKSPRGMEIMHRLVARADIVQHNMRYEAATRLGVDYESLRVLKPDLIYCHTRGFEHGERENAPGNDQTASAIAGQSYEDGGCYNGGRPLWSTSSLGDLGNGFLSAIGILQALYHRDRTGVGQFVDTSILYACLLNTSYAWLAADGTPAQRPHLDGQELRITARYGLYPCAEGWLCIAAVRNVHWEALAGALGHPDWLSDARFATADMQAEHDADLVKLIEAELATDTAAGWFARLDAAGVPVEVCDDQFALGVFDDPELIDRGWVTSYEQGIVGMVDQAGLLFDFSETPGRIAGPPLVVGDHSAAILADLGYSDDEIAALAADNVIVINDASKRANRSDAA